LRLRILAHYDVVASLMFTVPATFILMFITGPVPVFVRAGGLLVGTVLVYLALRAALPRLAAAHAILRRMREGTRGLGLIVSCRLQWDGKRSSFPYDKFLEDWAGNVARSQAGMFSGCLGKIVLLMLLPFILSLVGAAIYIGWIRLSMPGAIELPAGAWRPVLGWGAAFVVALVLAVGLVKSLGKVFSDQVGRFMEREHEERMRDDPIAREAHERHLATEAAKPPSEFRLKNPLPEDSSASIELVCLVEYDVGAETRKALGVARLTNRLNGSGVEPLLYEEARPGRVELLAGLPKEAVLLNGHWVEVSPVGSTIGLSLAGFVLAIALVFLVLNVQMLRASLPG
jgi:hypothetical protein